MNTVPPSDPSSTGASLVLVLHGPNLNLLGTRERELYGARTLASIDAELVAHGAGLGLEVDCFQSNHEGALIERLHSVRTTHRGVVINPAGYTHSSVALHDALRAIDLPAVEVHLTNTAGREDFRHRSLTAAACVGRIEGFGAESYCLALDALARILRRAGTIDATR